MQGNILQVTAGIQFFLLVGYLLYLLFRTYSPEDASSSLMSYVAVLIAIITFGLIFSLLFVAPLVAPLNRIAIMALVILDEIGLVLLVADLRKPRPSKKEVM
ncbi:hypothetical protein EU545_04450 [Candidatus Thorarchaeota archaeon]|nr:MAG: hypothetical protein EU545_04450 [Candidatus Thorarchaeota archaeon]